MDRLKIAITNFCLTTELNVLVGLSDTEDAELIVLAKHLISTFESKSDHKKIFNYIFKFDYLQCNIIMQNR